MTGQNPFRLVGISPVLAESLSRKKRFQNVPILSLLLLGCIVTGCLGAGLLTAKAPDYLDLMHAAHAPDREFLFGTDTLGRDIFSCIWHGGRLSIFIGLFSTVLSTFIAIVYGSFSGIAPEWLDALLMRLVDVFLSVPSLLFIIFLQAIWGKASVFSISVAIGLSSWFGIAKVVRTEVRRIRNSEYVIAAKCMGGGFFHILRRHFAPNFAASIMFMVVMNICSAIVAESTLSFMGLGLSLELVSWGSMLSLAQNSLMTGAWWVFLFPGVFLVIFLMCMTNIGNWLRTCANRKERTL